MEYVYHAILEPDPDGGLTVSFPDVPEALTGGADEAEAMSNAAEALGLALRGYLTLGRAIPRPAARGRMLTPIVVDAATALKLAVVEAFWQAGISKSELARRLGKQENEARRILDPDHPSKLAALETALSALGKKAIVSVRDAA